MNGKGYKVLIGLLVVLIALMGVVVVVVLRRPVETQVVTEVVEKETDDSDSGGGNGGLTIGYASEGVAVIDDADALQKAVDEAYAKARQPGVSMRYENDAYSSDGKNFTCSIGNPTRSPYDMFIAIYADDAFEDPLFISQLIRPGEEFSNITLERALEPGDYTVNCVFSQVDVEDGEQVMRGQVAVTLNFHVAAP